MNLTFEIPERTETPAEFRRSFIEAVRAAAAHAQFAGQLDADLVEEVYRALPVDEPRQ